MANFRRSFSIVSVCAALMLHATLLAAEPLVWCIGANGHSALEICIAAWCQHGASGSAHQDQITERATTGAGATADPAGDPCVDAKPIDGLLEAPQSPHFVALPVSVIAPIV